MSIGPMEVLILFGWIVLLVAIATAVRVLVRRLTHRRN
jgi:hypothetical protein